MIRFVESEPKYSPGTIVRHRRYGYRGLVVEMDSRCQASNQWYMRNRTQPDQNQPWYHVLVDRSTMTTYAAESNLEPDDSNGPIDHPLVSQYFDRLPDGRYVRNAEEFTL